MIGIVLPTRGLLFTQVIEALERERQGFDTKIYYSHDLPIPDGHNKLVKQALEDGVTHVWMVEEDTVPITGALEKLLACDTAIACVDYGVSGWGCVTRNKNNEILWCGVGCTLIKKEVFEKMEYPYFRVDKVLSLNDWTWKQLPEDYVKNKNYGTLDIYFCCKARELGFEIKQVEGECNHLELKELGRRGVNNGLHNIEIRPKINRKQIVNQGKNPDYV